MQHFEVGKRAVCIYDGGWQDGPTKREVVGPRLKRTYEIAKIVDTGKQIMPGWGTVYLRFTDFASDRLWLADCFRPVIARETSIEVFKQLDAPKPKMREREDA